MRLSENKLLRADAQRNGDKDVKRNIVRDYKVESRCGIKMQIRFTEMSDMRHCFRNVDVEVRKTEELYRDSS